MATIRSAWCAMALATLAATGAQARPAAPSFLVLGERTDAPRGFVDLCRTDPTYCIAPAGEGAGSVLFAETQAGADEQPITIHGDFAPTGALAGPAMRPVASAGAACPLDLRYRPAPLPLFGVTPESLSIAAPANPRAPALDFAVRLPSFLMTEVALPVPSCGTLRTAFSAPSTGRVAPAPAVRTMGVPARLKRSAPPTERKLLATINGFVNRHVRQASDMTTQGRDEVWQRSGVGKGAVGDCEDIAIEKRQELIENGFAAARLSLAVVYAPGLGLHTVLVARTADGDMVLDSRSPRVERWSRTGYSWITVQSGTDPMEWRMPLSGPAALAATANRAADSRV